MIITKGHFSSQELADGPKSAAKNARQTFSNIQIADNNFFVKHFPCWIYDIKGPTKDSARWAKMDPIDRFEFNCYRQDEVKSKIQHLIPNFRPISIHFRQGMCLKCNAIGDPRLFTAQCHTTSIFKHSLEIDYYHPEQVVPFHAGGKFFGHEPDENSIKNFLDKLRSDSVKGTLDSPPKIMSKAEDEACKPAAREPQVSRMSKVISQISQAASKVSKAAVVILPSQILPVRTAAATTTSTLLAAAGTSAALVVCVGGVVCYYEAKNIRCKKCKKLAGEIGCIEKCDN